MQRRATAAGLNLATPYQRLEDNLQRCNNVIVKLLDKSWSNQLQPLELPFDDWLSKLVRAFVAQAPPSIEVECDFTFGDHPAMFDPVRLEAAYTNILSNAVNALTGTDGSLENVSVSDPKIVIRSSQTDRGIEVTLTNNGPCMPQDKLESIMQPWVTTEFFGSAYGLSYVKCVMEQHLGGMEVQNMEPQGVKFTTWIRADF